jgi:streptogramin lyase
MTRTVVASLLAFTSLSSAAQQITEFPVPGAGFDVPYNYAPGLTAAPDGGIWFVGTGHIGRLSPSGTVQQFPVSAIDVAWGPDGNVWYTGTHAIGRLTPGGSTHEFPVPTTGAVPNAVVLGPDGNLWYTESTVPSYQGGGPPPPPCCAVGRITTTGVAADFALPSDLQPTSLVVGPDQRLWVHKGLYRVAINGTVQRVQTGPTNEWTDGQTLGPDGNVWFTAFGQDKVGKVTTAGVVTTYQLPAGTGPLGITAGPDGNVWFTEYGAGRIARITTSGVITEYATPTFGSNPKSIVTGADGNLWFVESGVDKIGRLTLAGPGSGKLTLTVPAVASAHGLNGTFFRSDVWLMNRSTATPAVVTLAYHCYGMGPCANVVQSVTLDPRRPVLLTDVVGSFLGAPESAGALEVSYAPGAGPISVAARVYTIGNGSLGAAVPALPLSEARAQGLFLGVSGSGGDPSTGFRSNAGAYNPNAAPVTVTFTLYAADGTLLGSTSRDLAPLEATQLSPNIFDLVGAGSVSSRNPTLVMNAEVPVFSFVTVIDNQSGDSYFLTPGDNASLSP